METTPTEEEKPNSEVKKKKGGKKLTKKQKAAAAKLAEEKRKKEEHEQEAREREIMSVMDSESRAYEREIKYQLEERERREWEESEVNKWEARLEKQREEWFQRTKEYQKWREYVEANKAVNPEIEADVNNWVSLRKEKEQINPDEVLVTCQEAEAIINVIQKFALETNNHSKLSRYLENINTLREMQWKKIDYVTSVSIQKSDELANSKNEVLVGAKTHDLKFGLWINIAKNPRIKKLDFPGISVSVEIPKHLALTSVAMRILHVSQADLNKFPSDYLSLGGILNVELLGLPPPPKKVKGWTLRQVTGPLGTLIKLNYPPTNNSVQAVVPNNAIGTSETQQTNTNQSQGLSANVNDWSPLRISCSLPYNILIREDVPTVAWWDLHTKKWKTDGISEIELERANNQVSFKTMNIGALSIVQSVYMDFPFESWELRPSGENEANLKVISNCKKVLEIKIGDGFCKLVNNKDPELKEFELKKNPPVQFLQALASSGINLIADERVEKYLSDFNSMKDGGIERKLYKDISRLVSGFSFSWSKWNNQKHLEKKFIFRAKGNLSWDPEPEPTFKEEEVVNVSDSKASLSGILDDFDSETKWRTCLYQEKSCYSTRLSENMSKYNDDLRENAKLHQHLYHCLMSGSENPTEIEKRVKNASISFHETVFQILSIVKIMSFSK